MRERRNLKSASVVESTTRIVVHPMRDALNGSPAERFDIRTFGNKATAKHFASYVMMEVLMLWASKFSQSLSQVIEWNAFLKRLAPSFFSSLKMYKEARHPTLIILFLLSLY